MGGRNIALLTELTRFVLAEGSINIAPLRGWRKRYEINTTLQKSIRPGSLLENSSLWFSVRSRCLCGERCLEQFHYRDTEFHGACTEKSFSRHTPGGNRACDLA